LTVQGLDEAQVAELQRMMTEVEHDFSISANTILSTIGLEHLKPGSLLTAEGGNPQIGSREFIAAIETIIQKRDSHQLKQGIPQDPGCTDGSEELILYHQ